MAQEYHGDIKFCVLELFPFQHGKNYDHVSPCCLCVLWHLILSQLTDFHDIRIYINLKVTPALHFKFYFPSISYNNMADT